MKVAKRLITLDANVLVAALKEDEAHGGDCLNILRKVPDLFLPCEPSVVYQEVCGALSRRVGLEVAGLAKEELDRMIHPMLLVNCDRRFCVSAYPLCHEYGIYSIDALYLKVALDKGAVLASLDKEGFADRVRAKNPPIEAYHVSEFPY